MNLKEQLEQCDELYGNNDYEGLIRKCDEILEECPDNQNAMGYKGISHCFLDEYDEALEILEKAVELHPTNYYLKNNLAMVYYDLGEYEKSLKLCDEGLKIKEFDWLSINKLKALIKLDMMDEAMEFDKTLNHNFDLGDVFLEEDMIGDALDYYYNLLKDNPGDYDLIEKIKLIICYYDLDMIPDVGDYYLTWIDDVFYNSDYEGLDSNCKDSKLNSYSLIKIIDINVLLKNSKKGIRLDELKEKLQTYDDKEFDALINKLFEINYLAQPKEGCVKLA